VAGRSGFELVGLVVDVDVAVFNNKDETEDRYW